jgi:hypothetical protein
MELILKLPDEDAKVREPVIDFDPAQYPCGLAAQFWYTWLAEQDEAA